MLYVLLLIGSVALKAGALAYLLLAIRILAGRAHPLSRNLPAQRWHRRLQASVFLLCLVIFLGASLTFDYAILNLP